MPMMMMMMMMMITMMLDRLCRAETFHSKIDQWPRRKLKKSND